MSIERNVAYNLAGFGIPLLLFLVTIPLYISLIGTARYGVLAIVWLVLGLFGAMDLGLGRAANQRIAALKDGTASERRSAFGTALASNLIIGAVGALLMGVAAYYIFGYGMKLEPALREEALTLVPLIALAVPMMTTLGILSGALMGRERFFIVNRITITNSTLFQMLPLAVAWLSGPTLAPLVVAALAARLVAVGSLYYECRREFGAGVTRLWTRSQMLQMLRYGGWVTTSAMVGWVLVFSDRILIGSLLGAVAVTIYAVPLDATRRIAILGDAVANALFPRLAVMDDTQSRDLSKLAVGALYAVATPIVAGFVMAADPLLKWWLGEEIGSQSAPLAQILVIAGWINIFAKAPYVRLQAQGRPNVVALLHLTELPFFIGGLWFALGSFGLAGAAWVYLARNTVDTIALFLLADRRIERGGLLTATFAIFVGMVLTLQNFTPLAAIPALALSVFAALSAAAIGWLVAPERMREVPLAFASRLFARAKAK